MRRRDGRHLRQLPVQLPVPLPPPLAHLVVERALVRLHLLGPVAHAQVLVGRQLCLRKVAGPAGRRLVPLEVGAAPGEGDDVVHGQGLEGERFTAVHALSLDHTQITPRGSRFTGLALGGRPRRSGIPLARAALQTAVMDMPVIPAASAAVKPASSRMTARSRMWCAARPGPALRCCGRSYSTPARSRALITEETWQPISLETAVAPRSSTTCLRAAMSRSAGYRPSDLLALSAAFASSLAVFLSASR